MNFDKGSGRVFVSAAIFSGFNDGSSINDYVEEHKQCSKSNEYTR